MQIAVDISESVVREAELRGIPIESLVAKRSMGTAEVASRSGFTRFGHGQRTPAETAADLRDLRTGQTVGGEITIAELI